MRQVYSDPKLTTFLNMLKRFHPFQSNEELIQEDKEFFAEIKQLRKNGKITAFENDHIFSNDTDLYHAGKVIFPNNRAMFYLLDYSFRIPDERLIKGHFSDLRKFAPTFEDMPSLRKNVFTLYRELHKQIWHEQNVDFMAAIEKTDLTRTQILAILEYENTFMAMRDDERPRGSLHGKIDSTIELLVDVQLRASEKLKSIWIKLPGVDERDRNRQASLYWHTERDVLKIYQSIIQDGADQLNEALSVFENVRNEMARVAETHWANFRDVVHKATSRNEDGDDEVTISEGDWKALSNRFYFYGDYERIKIGDLERPLKGSTQRTVIRLLAEGYRSKRVVPMSVIKEALRLPSYNIGDSFRNHWLRPYIKYDRERDGYYLDVD